MQVLDRLSNYHLAHSTEILGKDFARVVPDLESPMFLSQPGDVLRDHRERLRFDLRYIPAREARHIEQPPDSLGFIPSCLHGFEPGPPGFRGPGHGISEMPYSKRTPATKDQVLDRLVPRCAVHGDCVDVHIRRGAQAVDEPADDLAHRVVGYAVLPDDVPPPVTT